MLLEIEVWLGLTSPFGQRWMEALCQSDKFKLTRINIPTLGRLWQFKKKLSRGAFEVPYRQVEREYQEGLKWLEKLHGLHAAYAWPICQVDDMHLIDFSPPSGKERLIFCAAYPQLFRQELLERAGKIINFHPSYLPRCRGAHPIYWAIASREPFSGLSSHLMSAALDEGPILSRLKIPFDQDAITYEQLFHQITVALPACIADTASHLLENRAMIPQSELETAPTYFTNDLPVHRKIDWTEPFAAISARIRAGGAFSFSPAGHQVYWSEAVFSGTCGQVSNTNFVSVPPGTIVHLEAHHLWIKLNTGYLRAHYKLVYGNRPSRALMKLLKLMRIDLFDLKTGHLLH